MSDNKNRSFSQHQPSFCQHVLQAPILEATATDGASWTMRTPFLYMESQLDTQLVLAGVSRLHLVRRDGQRQECCEQDALHGVSFSPHR